LKNFFQKNEKEGDFTDLHRSLNIFELFLTPLINQVQYNGKNYTLPEEAIRDFFAFACPSVRQHPDGCPGGI
jgi:hypothetical protein